ncbi:glycosyltransferase family 4 protein [Microcoleus sp. FACHB-SPT15]|uniref:glycosyltransferase family 4 protein n=1 Tax=Microcoleus sp. FACHB-SPT15 TaxID=2692830 RepID=UPI001783F7F1|nr:glycosyltransferase family 1 protein [Microcoleus sp. FACHB-SPT15]MBD1807698.1 glycosyltransferase family 4 protein [Microcoleus sp. FACHB-SPT15]
MKVGIFVGELPESGGSYTFESELFHSLVNCGAGSGHTFVLYSWNQQPPPELSSVQHIQFVSLHRSLKERFRAKLSRTRARLLQKLQNPRINFQKEDLYQNFILDSLVSRGIEITWSLTPGCLTMELPFITTVWDLQHRLQPYFPEVGTQEQWNKREQFYTTLLKRASFIIAGTEAGKSEIERFYQVPTERIKLLPLPTPQFALNAPLCKESKFLEKYNIPNNYLFYPAQFWSHKNHVNLLLAVKWLRDKYELVFPVVFVGSDKGNQPYIKQLVAELDLTEHVTFLGFVPQEDLISLYRNAFALTFVSFFGPDNLPPLEAFALGCPVVYSEVSGAKEQIGDAALLVNPKKPEEIALAIKSLSDDKALRQTLVERGLARASQWTGEDYVKGVFLILDEFEAIRRCWTS